MVCSADLHYKPFTTHSLKYVTILCPFDLHHLFTNIDYLLKETCIKRRLQLEPIDQLLANWQCVDVFDSWPAR